MMATDLTQ